MQKFIGIFLSAGLFAMLNTQAGASEAFACPSVADLQNASWEEEENEGVFGGAPWGMLRTRSFLDQVGTRHILLLRLKHPYHSNPVPKRKDLSSTLSFLELDRGGCWYTTSYESDDLPGFDFFFWLRPVSDDENENILSIEEHSGPWTDNVCLAQRTECKGIIKLN